MNKDIETLREFTLELSTKVCAIADRMEAQRNLHCIYVASSKNGRVKWTSDKRRGEAWIAGIETGEYTYARRYYAEFSQILRTNYATAEKSSDVAGEGEYKNLFLAAIRDLAAINKRLNLDPDDGGAAPIIDAIDEMERDLQNCLRCLAELKQFGNYSAQQIDMVAYVDTNYGIVRTNAGLDMPVGTKLYIHPPADARDAGLLDILKAVNMDAVCVGSGENVISNRVLRMVENAIAAKDGK